ncbi:MAG: arginase family protein, partial [Candidatus Puniceispirillaceae bacterium]
AINLPDGFPQKLYISFDLDGLDPSILPATGTPVPGGLGYYQALDLVASAAKGRQIIGMDIVELAPDSAHRPSDFVAASICYHLMAIAGTTTGDR